MNPKKVYMIGIGGIGMSALAQWYVRAGASVSGADRAASVTTAMLISKGVDVHIGSDAAWVPADADSVVYSDAVPAEHPERARAREFGIRELSYFKALGEVTASERTLAVAGVNGKTTTTAMLAKILRDCGKDPTAIVGSIVSEFGSNFVDGGRDLFVVEACEYRDHLLELSPKILVITNIEWDHTDYFPSLEAMQQTFRTAIARVPQDGAIITNPHDPDIAPLLNNPRPACLVLDYTQEQVPPLKLIGEFNSMNAKAAKAAAKVAYNDLAVETIDAAIAAFNGTWRRFEYKGETAAGALVYDDYAHHPTAIGLTITGVREKFPDKRVVVAFHPHLYSRTRDLFKEFSQALAKADETIILPVFAAREAPDPTVSHEALAGAINDLGGHARAVASIEEAAAALAQYDASHILITMGAGDVYKAAEMITQ
jgi:UDP-N-acetylmuramate--alanine ligase